MYCYFLRHFSRCRRLDFCLRNNETAGSVRRITIENNITPAAVILNIRSIICASWVLWSARAYAWV